MGSPSHRSRDRRFEGQARQLVRESQSFLMGRYPDVLRAQGLPVPGWAWLSMLVHTPPDVLVAQAAEGKACGPTDHVTVLWQGALALLARELITLADRTGLSVEHLQHALIFDEGLERAWPVFDASVIGPSRFVQDVRQVLCRFRGTSQPW